jgi:hypothetical protein
MPMPHSIRHGCRGGFSLRVELHVQLPGAAAAGGQAAAPPLLHAREWRRLNNQQLFTRN